MYIGKTNVVAVINKKSNIDSVMKTGFNKPFLVVCSIQKIDCVAFMLYDSGPGQTARPLHLAIQLPRAFLVLDKS